MSARDDKAPLSIQVHSTVLCSPQPFSPHSLLPSVPSVPPYFSLPLLYLTQLSPPTFSFSSSSSSSCQAFVLLCRSDTFLKHVEEREKGTAEGERMEGRRKKRVEKLVRKLDTRVQVIFYLIVLEKRIGRVSQQRESWEIKGKQIVTEMERWRNSERKKATDM